MATENVIIEFIADTTQLKPAIDQLEKMGKVEKDAADQFRATNAQIAQQSNVIKLTADEFKKSGLTLDQLVAKVKKATSETSLLEGIEKSLREELQKVAASAKKFEDELGKSTGETKKLRSEVKTLNKELSDLKTNEQQNSNRIKELEEQLKKLSGATGDTTEKTKSLKGQLREMITQLTEMKVAGQDNTEQYQALAQKAGELKDAIADANQEVKNFGSDTSTIDGVISLAGGIAGGFAVAQGAVALFGDESEELQKTLLRVNAVMAILQGLQQIQVVLQKESAAATLANTIATKAQAAAQLFMNFVIGASTGALKLFRIALASTGVGLLVIGIIELVKALNSSNNELEEANALLEQQKSLIEATNKGIEDGIAIEQARAEQAGKSQSEIIRIQGRGLVLQKKALLEQNRDLDIQRSKLSQSSEAWAVLNKQIFENTQAIRGLDNDILLKSIELETQAAKEREDALKKAADDAKKAAEEAARKAKERRAAEFADFKAGIELQLLAAKEGSEEQLDLRKQLLRSQLQIDLDNEKLTLNQRKLLIQQFFKGRLDAEKSFVANRGKVLLENVASDLNAELQSLDLSNSRKLELSESLINLQAEMEITGAENNAAKIAEINAKRDKAIRDARIASIQEAANYEIGIATAINGPEQRRLAKVIENTKEELVVRTNAVDNLTALSLKSVQTRIAALNEEKTKGLVSTKDYNLQYAQLVDEQTKIIEDGEEKKRGVIKQTTEEAKQQAIELTQTILDAASQVIGVLDSLFQLQASKENDALDRRKKQLDELREAGAITEKEAVIRQKRLEADERRIRQQQAQREKTIAVFNAAIAVPQAVLKGLISGGPILAALYGAIAAAQLIIVASRPVPKFGKGKKDKYQGFGEVGETGTELIQSGGKMYVANKPQIVWLGKDDKVFNPQETINMLSHASASTERIVIPAAKNNGMKIDYEKFGKSVAKHVSTNVWVDGVQEQTIRQQEFIKWSSKRRAW